jgi:hypothetical protein
LNKLPLHNAKKHRDLTPSLPTIVATTTNNKNLRPNKNSKQSYSNGTTFTYSGNYVLQTHHKIIQETKIKITNITVQNLFHTT